MDNLESIKEKLASKENFENKLESTFESIYSCTRVWGAWSYNTMGVDDFPPFQRGDEAFDEMSTHLKNILDNKKIVSFDEFVDVVTNVVCNYDLYYNSDIDHCFDSQYFHQDVLDYIDLTDLHVASVRYQNSHLPKEPESKLTHKNKSTI